jgi:hypothetical protein
MSFPPPPCCRANDCSSLPFDLLARKLPLWAQDCRRLAAGARRSTAAGFLEREERTCCVHSKSGGQIQMAKRADATHSCENRTDRTGFYGVLLFDASLQASKLAPWHVTTIPCPTFAQRNRRLDCRAATLLRMTNARRAFHLIPDSRFLIRLLFFWFRGECDLSPLGKFLIGSVLSAKGFRAWFFRLVAPIRGFECATPPQGQVLGVA